MTPALADLTQDIAGPVPVELLQKWAAGAQDMEAAQTLLDPYRIEGVVVASDASGLTRMSEEMDMIDTLSLMSRPKKVLHALGVEIGGRPIGAWIADNTEMYYPHSVPADDVLQAMWEAQQRITMRKMVHTGMCIHNGAFYEIGGGLYGPDADLVEGLAEEYARGDEILVTNPLRRRLSRSGWSSTERADLAPLGLPDIHSITRAQGRPELRENNPSYPHPYNDEFMRQLNALEEASDSAALLSNIYAGFLRAAAVIFIARQRPTIGQTLPVLLDDLLANTLLDTILHDGNAASYLVKRAGGIAVLTLTDAGEALLLARDLRERFKRNNMPVKIGIDYGAVLVFERPGAQNDLAGDPVNLASKISEDISQTGWICVTERAAALLPHEDLSDSEPFSQKISNVEIRGFRL